MRDRVRTVLVNGTEDRTEEYQEYGRYIAGSILRGSGVVFEDSTDTARYSLFGLLHTDEDEARHAFAMRAYDKPNQESKLARAINLANQGERVVFIINSLSTFITDFDQLELANFIDSGDLNNRNHEVCMRLTKAGMGNLSLVLLNNIENELDMVLVHRCISAIMPDKKPEEKPVTLG